MPSKVDAIKRYVPALILAKLAEQPKKLTEPVDDSFEAAVLFADISGFTALTEKFSKNNPRGIEELAGILDIYIGKLIDYIENHGGDIVKFAGDALFAVWKVDEDKSLPVESHRAVRCAMLIQQKLHNFKVASGVNLSVRIGVGCGLLHSILIGGTFKRWELLVAGEPMNQVGNAGKVAEPGEVAVSKEVYHAIKSINGAEVVNKRLQMYDIQATRISCQLFSPDLPEQAEEALRSLIPRAILSRIDNGLDAWLADLRQVTVIFMKIGNFKYARETPVEEVQKLMKVMQSCLYEHYGSINRFGVDDKGAILLGAFGLPPLEPADDAVRATKAALMVYQQLTELNLDPIIGITTGTVFCGSVGNDKRCEYTMHGVTVNLAARLMTSASTILCDRTTYELAKDTVRFDVLEPINVKGSSQKVEIFKPIALIEKLGRPEI